jgi:hypothetical protein
MMAMPSSINLIVYSPHRFAARLTVSPLTMISELRSRFPIGSSHFVCNGEILMDTMTFAFYHIREMEVIVVVPGSVSEAQKWMPVTEDSDSLSEKVQFILNPRTSVEIARLKDLALAQEHRRPGPCRRIRSVSERAIAHPTESFPLKVDYPALDGPNCEPLPVGWAMVEGDRKN